MNVEEKMQLIRELIELNDTLILDKLENNNNQSTDTLDKIKVIAKRLSDEGIGEFDFTSDNKFIESLNNFFTNF